MRRRGIAAAALAALTLGVVVPTASGETEAPPLEVAEPSVSTEVSPNKIDVMGIWAHPDDDATFTTPCGVWNDRYDVDCGIIMLTRGEGGSNSVGDEAGPDLGLRRENEDRASHYRSGTVDIYNIDAVDFFYNTSAALTDELWGAQDIVRQVTHVLRQTQPEVVLGFAPTPAGHGHHQYAGRIIWEAAAAAADPEMFPEQLSGPDAVEPWRVKVITSGADTNGEGGTDGPQCNAGFEPADNNPFTVVGTWAGYDSPYSWLPGNVQGQEPGTAQSWAQVGGEGALAHPTQARTKLTEVWEATPWFPECLRYGIAQSEVPFQPNGSEDNARDDAILFGSVIADPGGMPLGSTYTIEAEDYFQAPDEHFEVTVTSQSGEGTVDAGSVTLDVPEGWSVSGDGELGPISDSADASVTFEVTAAGADYGRYQLSASFDNGEVTAYNDTRVEITAGVEGRFERWGNYAAYDLWAEEYTYVSGRSAAETQIGAGESVTVPVVVTNRTGETHSGTVSVDADEDLVATEPMSFADLAPGSETSVELTLTHTDPSDIGGYVADVAIVTDVDGGATSTEVLSTYVVPTVAVPEADEAPVLDGQADDVYGETSIEIGHHWEGAECDPDGIDCGEGSTAKLAWHEDDLYIHAEVTDDVASAAATPERCFGHWLVDSVEILLDPQATSRDTSSTFKTGIMPFTDDPENSAGNGVDGPCWSRDADNHQGFSSGPLADTVEGAPNSPGQEVAVDVTRNADGTYEGGSYTVEVKIPLANLPAAVSVPITVPTGELETNEVDPTFMGLNVTPYDSDNQDFIGETRTGWSAFGSQQSEPYRWGHAYLVGYQPPADRSLEPREPIIPDTALLGVESPQTIYQSAVRGTTIAGQPASRALDVVDVEIGDPSVTLSVDAEQAGTVRAYAWQGNPAMVPVWVSSCEGDQLGFSTCSAADSAAAPWAPDMGRHLLGSAVTEVAAGASTVSLELDTEALDALRTDGAILVSWAAADGGVNAWHFPVVEAEVPTEEPTTEEPTTEEPTTTPPPGDLTDPSDPADPATPPADGGPSGDLPTTGADVMTVVLIALLLAVAGGAVALGVRRMRSTS